MPEGDGQRPNPQDPQRGCCHPRLFIWFLVFRQLPPDRRRRGMLGNFGRSRHRVTTKDTPTSPSPTSPASTRPRTRSRRSSSSSRTRRSSAAGRADPARRAARRRARLRQDAAGEGDRGRGGCAVLLDLRLGLRRDVRRRRREPRARPVQAGQGIVALHHLPRRDRRRRSAPRRRVQPGRARRARADAQRDPRRDGRLRDSGDR
jgi:hypothetical protein